MPDFICFESLRRTKDKIVILSIVAGIEMIGGRQELGDNGESPVQEGTGGNPQVSVGSQDDLINNRPIAEDSFIIVSSVFAPDDFNLGLRIERFGQAQKLGNRLNIRGKIGQRQG